MASPGTLPPEQLRLARPVRHSIQEFRRRALDQIRMAGSVLLHHPVVRRIHSVLLLVVVPGDEGVDPALIPSAPVPGSLSNFMPIVSFPVSSGFLHVQCSNGFRHAWHEGISYTARILPQGNFSEM